MSTAEIEIVAADAAGLPQLTPQMQRHVDRTLAADRKGGEALWEKALAVADARAEAESGEWGSYLEATGQHERAARRLVAIAERGRADARFRDAIISGWLTFSVGAIAAQADDDLLTQLLSQPRPPTRAQMTGQRPDTGVRSLPAPAPAESTAPETLPLEDILGPITRKMVADRGWEFTGAVRTSEQDGRPVREYQLKTPPLPSGNRNLLWKNRAGIDAIIRVPVAVSDVPAAEPAPDPADEAEARALIAQLGGEYIGHDGQGWYRARWAGGKESAAPLTMLRRRAAGLAYICPRCGEDGPLPTHGSGEDRCDRCYARVVAPAPSPQEQAAAWRALQATRPADPAPAPVEVLCAAEAAAFAAYIIGGMTWDRRRGMLLSSSYADDAEDLDDRDVSAALIRVIAGGLEGLHAATVRQTMPSVLPEPEPAPALAPVPSVPADGTGVLSFADILAWIDALSARIHDGITTHADLDLLADHLDLLADDESIDDGDYESAQRRLDNLADRARPGKAA